MPSISTRAVSNEQLKELAARLEAVAGQDMPFLTLLIELQAKLMGGLSGAVFVVRPDEEPRLTTVYPMAADRHVQVDPDRVTILANCVERCRKAGELSVYRVGMSGRVYHAVCTPLMLDGRVEGVCVVVTAPEDQTELQPYLAHVQWSSRLYSGHVAARRLRARRRETAETRKALNILAAAHQAEHFQEACMAVANQLAVQVNATRVSVGWARGSSIRLIAMSDTDFVDRRQELSRSFADAMEECFDQARAVVVPDDAFEGEEDGPDLVVSRCHRALIGEDGRQSVCSVPLRYREDVAGVLTVEWPSQPPIDRARLSQIQAIADLVAPRLVDRAADDRSIAAKVLQTARHAAAGFIGPHQVGWKLVGLALFALLVYASIFKWAYRVEAPFEFEASARRQYAAAFTGTIDQVNVRKGDAVKAGDLLARLDDRELRVLRDAGRERLKIAEIEYRQAMNDAADDPARLADAERLRAYRDLRRKEFALYEIQLVRAEVRAEEDGIVLKGDWKERQGVRVELGTTLFEVAPSGPNAALRARIEVDDVDIDRVRVGSSGELALQADPGTAYPFEVTRVVPIGESQRGTNIFAVYAGLAPDTYPEGLKPGMKGVARIEAGRERVIWILTHRFVDFLRLAMW